MVFNAFTRLLTPLTQLDTQCGFKLYPAAIAKHLFGQMEEMGWAHDVELLCRASLEGIPVRTMPIEWTHQEASKINVLRDGFNMFVKTLLISIRLRMERPTAQKQTTWI